MQLAERGPDLPSQAAANYLKRTDTLILKDSHSGTPRLMIVELVLCSCIMTQIMICRCRGCSCSWQKGALSALPESCILPWPNRQPCCSLSWRGCDVYTPSCTSPL